MARNLDDVMASWPRERRLRIEARALKLATLKDLRQAAQQTQEQMAATLGLGQNTVSRLEKRRDMLLSTLSHYVQSMDGQLNLVVLRRPPSHGHRTFWCETFSDPTVSIGPASAQSLFLDPQ